MTILTNEMSVGYKPSNGKYSLFYGYVNDGITLRKPSKCIEDLTWEMQNAMLNHLIENREFLRMISIGSFCTYYIEENKLTTHYHTKYLDQYEKYYEITADFFLSLVANTDLTFELDYNDKHCGLLTKAIAMSATRDKYENVVIDQKNLGHADDLYYDIGTGNGEYYYTVYFKNREIYE